MPIAMGNLTAEERSDFQESLKWYEENGWVGDEARRLAWTDLQRKHRRLRQFADVPTEDT